MYHYGHHIHNAAPLVPNRTPQPTALLSVPSCPCSTRFQGRDRAGALRCAGVPLSRILEGSIDGALRARLRTAMASLLDAFGCSMLRWGLYNADPHAGNLLLQVGFLGLKGF